MPADHARLTEERLTWYEEQARQFGGVAVSSDELLALLAEMHAGRELAEGLSRELCGYCAGTAIKTGVWDVSRIEPARVVTRVYSEVTGNTDTTWTHVVHVEGREEPFETTCLASRVRLALARLRPERRDG